MQAIYTKEMLMPYRQQGYSNEEIAKVVGCSYWTVLQRLGTQDPELTHIVRTQARQNRLAMERVKREYREKCEREAREKMEREETKRRIASAMAINNRYVEMKTAINEQSHEVEVCQKKINKKKKDLEELEVMKHKYQQIIENTMETIERTKQEIEKYNIRLSCANDVIDRNQSTLTMEANVFREARNILEMNEIAWRTVI